MSKCLKWGSSFSEQLQEITAGMNLTDRQFVRLLEYIDIYISMNYRRCQCNNVEIGSYDNQVQLVIPSTVTLRMNNPERIVRKTVAVDACLAGELNKLWKMGIATTGCCCGHNKTFAYISVEEQHIQQMKDMGYEVQPNEMYPEREDSFKPKSLFKLSQTKEREK